ncbi:2002_t:CDS:2, partial [Dentiscutata heterogama]
GRIEFEILKNTEITQNETDILMETCEKSCEKLKANIEDKEKFITDLLKTRDTYKPFMYKGFLYNMFRNKEVISELGNEKIHDFEMQRLEKIDNLNPNKLQWFNYLLNKPNKLDIVNMFWIVNQTSNMNLDINSPLLLKTARRYKDKLHECYWKHVECIISILENIESETDCELFTNNGLYHALFKDKNFQQKVDPVLEAKHEALDVFIKRKEELEDFCHLRFLIDDMENTHEFEEFLPNGDYKPYFWKDNYRINESDEELVKKHWVEKMKKFTKDLNDKNINWLEYIKKELLKLIEDDPAIKIKSFHIKKELLEILDKIIKGEEVTKEEIEKIGTIKTNIPFTPPIIKPSDDSKKDLSETENNLQKDIESIKKEIKDLEKEKSKAKSISEIIDLIEKLAKDRLLADDKEQTLKDIKWLKRQLTFTTLTKDEANDIIKKFSLESRGKDRVDYLKELFDEHYSEETVENLLNDFKKNQAIPALNHESSLHYKTINELKKEAEKKEITDDEKEQVKTLTEKYNGKINNIKIKKSILEGKPIEPDEIELPEFEGLTDEEQKRLQKIDQIIKTSKSAKELDDKEKLDLEIDMICNKYPEIRKDYDKRRRERRDYIINQLKDKPLAKDLFDELHEKCNEKYTELIANNAEELAEELKRQINKEKNSKNLENIKKNVDKLKETNAELGENVESLLEQRLTRIKTYEKILEDINKESDIEKLNDKKEIDEEIQKLKQDDTEYPNNLITELTKQRNIKKEKVIETNKYNEYEEIINAPFDHPQTLIDAIDLDKIKQLDNDKLLDNKQKINLENLYRKKLNELNTKVVQEEKEKYNKIEKMIKECEDPVLLNSEMFDEIYRLIESIDEKIIGHGKNNISDENLKIAWKYKSGLSVDEAKACVKNGWIINDEIKIVNKKLNYRKFPNIDVVKINKEIFDKA